MQLQMASVSRSVMRLRASWDLYPNPAPVPPTKPAPNLSNKVSKRAPQTQRTEPNATTSFRNGVPVSEHLKFSPLSVQGYDQDQYLGYDRWLPIAPKVKKPRSVYNAASLAYIGDCIYELYARRHFLFPPLSIDEYNARVVAVVRCEAQDSLLKKLLDGDYLSEEERDVLRWGKNVGSRKTRTKRRAGVAVYNRASSLETLEQRGRKRGEVA